MAKFHAFCLVMVFSLLTFALPVAKASKLPCPRFLSFQLRLIHTPTPLNLHNATSTTTQPLTPHLFSDQPLFHSMSRSSHNPEAQYEIVGRARGLCLADPAAAMALRYLFFTATLQRLEGGREASEEADGGGEVEGSLVLMGSVGSGAISVVGGTRAFAFASGQAKVSIAAAGSDPVTSPSQLIISFDVELRYEQQESEDAIALV